MAIHPKDRKASNPRLQCSVCTKWKRLYGYRKNAAGVSEMFYRFYGGCGYTNGDHLAGTPSADGCRDVCDDCCQTECRRIAEERAPRNIEQAIEGTERYPNPTANYCHGQV